MGASLLVKSYQRLRSTNVGCITDNVLTMRIKLPGKRYKTPGPAPANFFEALLQRVRALPGVEAAAFVTGVPGQGYMGDSYFTIAEHPPLAPGNGTLAIDRSADPDYFAAMGIPVLRGRTFGDNQTFGQVREVVISESFAKRFLSRRGSPWQTPALKGRKQGTCDRRNRRRYSVRNRRSA